ncbi:hypothetical protein VNO77_02125 [Canavalia gladiata]|uniref:Uncharacterized protein n=1 Tax=Canavalia gladiata TaxID=3824 RepID=A0AAN9MUF8_CANGL
MRKPREQSMHMEGFRGGERRCCRGEKRRGKENGMRAVARAMRSYNDFDHHGGSGGKIEYIREEGKLRDKRDFTMKQVTGGDVFGDALVGGAVECGDDQL